MIACLSSSVQAGGQVELAQGAAVGVDVGSLVRRDHDRADLLDAGGIRRTELFPERAASRLDVHLLDAERKPGRTVSENRGAVGGPPERDVVGLEAGRGVGLAGL